MRIGLDFDGTLADVTHAKLRYARERWGVELDPAETWRPGGVEALGEDRYEELIHAVHATELTLEMPPLPGVLEVTERLGRSHELYVITARHDDEVEWARAWLDHHGLRMADVVHTCRGSKAPSCLDLELSVLLDDYPFNFEDLAEATVPALIDAPYNRTLDRLDHVRLVEHWAHFETLCEELAARE